MRDKGGLNLFSYICKRNKANFMNIKRPLILVSNDDGYHAKGINCLVDMLRDMADIVVCAPESAARVCHSFLSHSTFASEAAP